MSATRATASNVLPSTENHEESGLSQQMESVSTQPPPSVAAGPSPGSSCDDSHIPTDPTFTAYIRNIRFDLGEDRIQQFFEGLHVSKIWLPRDRMTGGNRGFGWVWFTTLEDLRSALSMSGSKLKGRPIQIRDKPPPRSPSASGPKPPNRPSASVSLADADNWWR